MYNNFNYELFILFFYYHHNSYDEYDIIICSKFVNIV